jgi:hypothetical protein
VPPDQVRGDAIQSRARVAAPMVIVLPLPKGGKECLGDHIIGGIGP